jgi:hypothetical protein
MASDEVCARRRANLHGIVHDTVYVTLVTTGICRVSMENFTNRIDPSSLRVATPKVLLDMLGGVDAKSINCSSQILA